MRLEAVDQRGVERDGRDDRAANSGGAHDRELSCRGAARDRPDAEAGGTDDRDVGIALQELLERGAIACHEGTREYRIPGESLRFAVRAGQLLLVRGDCGAQSGLEPRIDASRLGPRRDGRKAPESGDERQQREQQEVGDKLDLETPHQDSLQLLVPTADRSLERVVGY